MSPFHPAVLALVITATAYASTTPTPIPLTGSDLKTLCTVNPSTMQICAGYFAGASDELELTSLGAARTMGADTAALSAPCPGKQLPELTASALKELNAHPTALSGPALATAEGALHPPLGCDGSRPSTSEANAISYFADGDQLKAFCTGSDPNERLQCEGYIRAITDELLRAFNDRLVRENKSCTPTWQTSDQAVSATIVYLNTHLEHGKVPAPTLIWAALLSPSCPLAPVSTAPR